MKSTTGKKTSTAKQNELKRDKKSKANPNQPKQKQSKHKATHNTPNPRKT